MAVRSRSSLSGLLIVDKPEGVTSMDVVRRVRYAAARAKTGHAGTLDPLATGVVVCCLGSATKLVASLMDQTKIYETLIDLSANTCTDDREGDLEPVTVSDPPTVDRVRLAIAQFVGRVSQTPPAYSAVHINGRRAYKLARRGESVEMPSRTVRIDSIELLSYDWPRVAIRVTCGKGTYIRSLARDLGRELGTGGYVASLRRLAVGPFTHDLAIPLDRLGQTIEQPDLLQWSPDG